MSHPAVRGRIVPIFVIFLCANFPREVSARPAAKPAAVSKPKLSLIGAEAPAWSWRQILASPRIGGRLTAVAVDGKDPDRIFVGTEEGTLVRSIDGGITWDERTLTPFLVQGRSVGGPRIARPAVDDSTSSNFALLGDPPDRFYADETAPPFGENLAYSLLLGGIYASGPAPFIGTGNLESVLLSDVIESRREETLPVNSIAVCAGFEFPLLVATSRELYGSGDDGITSIRLFFVQGDAAITRVICSPFRKDEIAVATTTNVFRSVDGGLSFNAVNSEGGATAIAFAREPTHGVEILYSAEAETLNAGDPESTFGLQYLYPPEDEDPESSPWEKINWIEATKGGEVWLATDDGLRVSRGYGEKFRVVERGLFSQQVIKQVLVDEGERIAVMMRDGRTTKDQIYSSDDEGITWHPFFSGITRRTMRQMAVGPSVGGISRWWVVTSGELWTNIGPGRVKGMALSAWAKKSLAETPSMAATVDRVLETTRLSTDAIHELAVREKNRVWIPYLDLKMNIIRDRFDGRRELSIGDMRAFDNTTARDNFQIFLQATWALSETKILIEESGTVLPALYELRRQIAFAAEDAWNERALHLERVASGELGDDQAEVLRARVEALETVLDQWGWKNASEER